MEEILQKECYKCKVIKSSDNFYIKKTGVLFNWCKNCESERSKDYKIKTKYKPSEKRSIVKKEKLSGETKTCTTCNINKPQSEFQNRRNQCKICRSNYSKTYNARDEVKIHVNNYFKERKEDDPGFLMLTRLRARLTGLINKINSKKYDSTMNLVGCNIQEFKEYMEKQFIDDMSWDSEDLSIDHKIPCSHFDLTNENEQRRCFHYTNLQPMKLKDNISKGNKLLPEYNDLLKKLENMFK